MEEIKEKLLMLEKDYERCKSTLSEKNNELIDKLFEKIRRGLQNLQENNYKMKHEKEGDITSIKIFMNKIYEILNKGD